MGHVEVIGIYRAGLVAVLLQLTALAGCTAIIAKAKGGYMDSRPPAQMYFGEWVGLGGQDGERDPDTRGAEAQVVRLRFRSDGVVHAATFSAQDVAQASTVGPAGIFDRVNATSEHKGAWRYDNRPDWPWRVDVGPWKPRLVEPRRSWTAGLWFSLPGTSNRSRHVTLVPPAEFFVGRWLGFDFRYGRALELRLDADGSAHFWWYTINGLGSIEQTLSLDQEVAARWRLDAEQVGLWVIDIGHDEPILIMLNADHAKDRGFGLRLSVPRWAFDPTSGSFTMRLVRPGTKGFLGQ